MQNVLLAAVLVLTVLVLLNLALTLAVIRRLRQQMADQERWGMQSLSPPVGTPIPDFTAETTDGTTITADTLRTGRALIAFLSIGCTACHEQMPQLREHVTALRAAGDHVLVAVNAGQASDSDLISAFTGVAPVVAEGEGRPVAAAFGIDGYPTYVMVEDGSVSDVYPTARDISAPVSV